MTQDRDQQSALIPEQSEEKIEVIADIISFLMQADREWEENGLIEKP